MSFWDSEPVAKPENFDQVIRNVMGAADAAALAPRTLENPRATPHEMTRAEVMAAFECALVNKLITINDPSEWNEWIELDKRFDS